MITHVHLVNWKSHADSRLEFSRGVNALIGINGAGKSSVLDAVSFALFGTFPSLKARRLGLDDLIMKKPQKKEYCTVEVGFSSNGSSYSVKRVVERDAGRGRAATEEPSSVRTGKAGRASAAGTTSAEIRKDGARLQAGPELVTAEVVRALQMDYDLFSKAVYSEQNGMDYFLRMQKGRRMDEIDRMLKVDRFEDVRAGAVSIANRIRSASEEKLKVIADMEREDYPSKAGALRNELAGMESDAKAAGRQLSAAREDKEKLGAQLEAMEKAEDEFNETKFRLESAKSSLAEACGSLERAKARLEGRDAAAIGRDVGRAEADTEQMRMWIDGSEKGLQALRQELGELNGKIKLENDSVNSLQSLGARCPVCESAIPEGKKKELCSRHRDEAAALRAKASATVESIDKASREIEAMRGRLSSRERELAKLAALSSEAGEIASLEKRISAYGKQKEGLEERLGALSEKYDKEKISGLRTRLREAAEAEASLSSRHIMLARRIEDKAGSLKDIEGRIRTIGQYKTEVGNASAAVQGMNGFVKALKITQEQLRSEFLKAVNAILGDVWKLLYPYGDFQGIRLSAEEDYSLELQEAGTRAAEAASSGWVGVEAVSGGERSIAALALRIAFSRVFLPNLKWLILDEPTHNLDANAIGQFSEILREKMSLFAEQVFIITHEDRISEGVTGNIYRLERDKESDGVTKIAAM